MATITNLKSTLTGSDGDIGRVFQARLYTGPIGYWMNAVAYLGTPPGMPAEGDGGWRKCLGGWWSAYQNCAYEGCGGTIYNWNKWDGVDAKFVQNGNTPGRLDGPIEWDLGEIEPNESLGIFIYARPVRGTCDGQRMDGKAATFSVAFPVPMPKLCPPDINRIEMWRDICEEIVGADVIVDIPALGGKDSATLIVEYVPTGGGGGTISQEVTPNSTATVHIPKLSPNMRYCFRARLTASKVESEWSEQVCEQTLFFPRADWVVPELSDEECEAMVEGDCIPEFEKDTPGLEECKGDN